MLVLLMEESVEEITVRERLTKYDARHDSRVVNLYSVVPEKYKRASVFIGLKYVDSILNVLLTLRSSTLRHHASTVSFPGGKCDADDVDEIDTALREAQEEIGLDRLHVDVICTLPPMIASPNYLTTAVVGFVNEDFTPSLNTDEVAEIFYLPLGRFLQDERHTTSFIERGGPDSAIGLRYVIHRFSDEIKGQTMETWGFTAHFCCNLATVIFNKVGFNFWDGVPITLDDPYKQNIDILTKRFLLDDVTLASKM